MNVAHAHHSFRPDDVSGADIEATIRVLRLVTTRVAGKNSDTPVTMNDGVGLSPLDLAKRLKMTRNVRNAMLPVDLFGEPAWDILLALYVAECEQYRLKVSDVVFESNVPATTGLRWIEALIQNGMAARKPYARDARVIHVELTSSGMTQMTECLSALSERHFL